MPVTRTVTLTFERDAPYQAKNDLVLAVRESFPEPAPAGPLFGAFCDSITIFQSHDYLPPGPKDENGRATPPLPVINNGCFMSIDGDGVVEYSTEKTIEHVGSYDTKLRIRCDGWKVMLSGNVSRFQRPDNVFGLSVLECVDKANTILAGMGLPAFTSRMVRFHSEWKDMGARITRVDLTNNYFAGSLANADALCRFFAGQGAGRQAPKAYGQNGVSWGEGSKFWYRKLYNKAREIQAHADGVLPDVLQWVIAGGLVRDEVSLKSRYLDQHGLKTLDAWKPREVENIGVQTMENVIYGRFAELISRNSVNVQDAHEIPGKLGLYASSYRAGKEIWLDENIPSSTKRRIRKQLLEHGIDIKQPLNVMSMCARPRMIELRTAVAPDWYWQQQEAQQAAA